MKTYHKRILKRAEKDEIRALGKKGGKPNALAARFRCDVRQVTGILNSMRQIELQKKRRPALLAAKARAIDELRRFGEKPSQRESAAFCDAIQLLRKSESDRHAYPMPQDAVADMLVRMRGTYERRACLFGKRVDQILEYRYMSDAEKGRELWKALGQWFTAAEILAVFRDFAAVIGKSASSGKAT